MTWNPDITSVYCDEKEFQKRATITVVRVEPKAREQQMETLSSSEIAKGLDANGKPVDGTSGTALGVEAVAVGSRSTALGENTLAGMDARSVQHVCMATALRLTFVNGRRRGAD